MSVIRWLRNLFLNGLVIVMNLFIKRDGKIILCGSWVGEKFSDNSRYLFQYLATQDKYKKVIWVSDNESLIEELVNLGYEAYKSNTFLGYYYHLKSGVHIICNSRYRTTNYNGDINTNLSMGARRIQLWHGIPLKKFDGLIEEKNQKNTKNSYLKRIKNSKIWRHYIGSPGGWDDYEVVASSPLIKNIFIKAFNLTEEKIIISSYPRNCKLLRPLIFEQKVIDKVKKSKLTILYLPTFREDGRSVDHPLEDKQIQEYLISENLTWVEKKHSASKNKEGSNRLTSNLDYLYLDKNFDINVILPYVDVLITDYSSVSFDFIFFDKPVQYFVPDFEYYKFEDRGFALNFDDYSAGWISNTTKELLENLKNQIENPRSIKIRDKISEVKRWTYQNKEANYEDIALDLGL